LRGVLIAEVRMNGNDQVGTVGVLKRPVLVFIMSTEMAPSIQPFAGALGAGTPLRYLFYMLKSNIFGRVFYKPDKGNFG
jgi:hypothetical protein